MSPEASNPRRGVRWACPHSRGLTPIERRKRFERPMHGNADSALGHMKPIGGLSHAASIDGNRLDDFALPYLQLREKRVDLAERCTVDVILHTKCVGHVLDRHGSMPAAPAQGVNELVADDRCNPRADGSRLIPGPSLEMNREQNFLHDVFRVPYGGAGDAAPVT